MFVGMQRQRPADLPSSRDRNKQPASSLFFLFCFYFVYFYFCLFMFLFLFCLFMFMFLFCLFLFCLFVFFDVNFLFLSVNFLLTFCFFLYFFRLFSVYLSIFSIAFYSLFSLLRFTISKENFFQLEELFRLTVDVYWTYNITWNQKSLCNFVSFKFTFLFQLYKIILTGVGFELY
jgi:hypothetical protein